MSESKIGLAETSTLESLRFANSHYTVSQVITMLMGITNPFSVVHVECGECRACCTTYENVFKGCKITKEGTRNICGNLHNGNCSIYENRPTVCKQFSCYGNSFGMINTLLVKHGAPVFNLKVANKTDRMSFMTFVMIGQIMASIVPKGTNIDSFFGAVCVVYNKIGGSIKESSFDSLPKSIRKAAVKCDDSKSLIQEMGKFKTFEFQPILSDIYSRMESSGVV